MSSKKNKKSSKKKSSKRRKSRRNSFDIYKSARVEIFDEKELICYLSSKKKSSNEIVSESLVEFFGDERDII